MEILVLRSKVGNLGIDADDCRGELVLAGKRIQEMVAPNHHIAAGTRLVPSVAVAAEQNGRT